MDKDLMKMAGRMLVCGFDGLEPGEHAKAAARDLFIAHWILFARNVADHDQLSELNRWLNRETRSNNGVTPYITIDQEGGIVSRLHGDLNTYPGAMAIAATGREKDSYRAAKITADHLSSLGFNINLAPVADINSNPLNPIVGPRSFGSDTEMVSTHVNQSCKGYLEGGVLPVIKHFPGHGDTSEDSHLALPTLPHSRKVLEQREMIPFVRSIQQGVPAVMVAHLLIPSLTEQPLPASLNPDIIQGILREKMGFQGLVMTDCLEMHGISLHYNTGDAVLKAIEAGADLCFISHSYEEQEKGLRAIYDALKSGKMPLQRIEESLSRQQKTMKKHLARQWDEGLSIPGWKGNLPEPEMMDISRKSLTVLKNRNFLPSGGLKDRPGLHLLYITRPEQFIGENTVSGGDPLEKIKEAFPQSTYRAIPADNISEELQKKPLKLDRAEKLLIITCDSGFYPEAVKNLQKLMENPCPVGVAVMRTPYEAAFFTEADFLLLGYENSRLASDSLIELLTGRLEASGTCPVEIPGL